MLESTNPIVSGTSSGSSYVTSGILTDLGALSISASGALTNHGGIAANSTTLIAAPTIITDIADIDALEGETATFTVVAEVQGTAVYQWYKDTVAIEGANTASLELTEVTGDDEGVYYVTVENTAGMATSSNATLSVTEIPVILEQPVSVTTTVGGSATFSVDARTEGTVTYTWFQDGTAIDASDASSLTLSGVALDSVGAYTVEIANEAGSVVSDAAMLDLTAGNTVPSALSDSIPVEVDADGSITYESSWFGAFIVEPDSLFGWVYAEKLGWTFMTSISTPEVAYIYPLLMDQVLYIGESSGYPSWAYSYEDTSWVYLPETNDPSTGSIWGYVWTLEEWVEYFIDE